MRIVCGQSDTIENFGKLALQDLTIFRLPATMPEVAAHQSAIKRSEEQGSLTRMTWSSDSPSRLAKTKQRKIADDVRESQHRLWKRTTILHERSD